MTQPRPSRRRSTLPWVPFAVAYVVLAILMLTVADGGPAEIVTVAGVGAVGILIFVSSRLLDRMHEMDEESD